MSSASPPPSGRPPHDLDERLLDLLSRDQTGAPRPPGRPGQAPPTLADILLPETTERERQLQDFARTLHRLTPRVWVTRALIAFNVLVFVAMAVAGADLRAPTSEILVRWGANYGPLVADGQWWRVLTAAFIHVGLLHIAINMWALASCGRALELLLGNVGFLLLYLVSAVAGNLAGLAWNPAILSAGASGAIFGVFGGLLGFALPRGDSIPPDLLRQLRNSGGTVIVINLIISFGVPNIDISAHIGGLVAGFLCGLLLSQPVVPAARAGRVRRNILVAVVATTALLAAAVAVHRHLA